MEIDETLKALVIEEATNLKKYAHADELAKLGFSALEPESAFRCVYGLMTGNCGSERSKNLIESCCLVTYKIDQAENNLFNGLERNGPPKEAGSRNIYRLDYLSPIETFIYWNKKTQWSRSKQTTY